MPHICFPCILGDLLLEFFRYYSEFDFSKYTIDLNSGGICEEKASEDCMRVINPCVEGHNICTNVRKHHLKLFQDKCKLVLKYLESNLIKKIGSPWGLSYVVKPDLCTETTKEIRHVISIDKLFSESETENDQLETKQNETDNDQLASKQVFRR